MAALETALGGYRQETTQPSNNGPETPGNTAQEKLDVSISC